MALDDVAILESVTNSPPAHFMLKVESFSLLSQLIAGTQHKRYESEPFQAGGYKWKFVLHLDGDKSKNVDGCVSVYLMIAETDKLPPGWVVSADFKLFIYDHIRDKYHVFRDSKFRVRRFHAMQMELGFPKLLSLEDFNEYLFNDSCVFGAEVFVFEGKYECLSTIKDERGKYIWNIENFSLLVEENIKSEVFTAGGLKWYLDLYPKGDNRVRDESLSVYVWLNDSNETLTRKRKLCAQFKLLVKNQQNGKHVSFTACKWFIASEMAWGCTKLMSLKDLRDPSKGYLVKDTLIMEAKVELISRVKNLEES